MLNQVHRLPLRNENPPHAEARLRFRRIQEPQEGGTPLYRWHDQPSAANDNGPKADPNQGRGVEKGFEVSRKRGQSRQFTEGHHYSSGQENYEPHAFTHPARYQPRTRVSSVQSPGMDEIVLEEGAGLVS